MLDLSSFGKFIFLAGILLCIVGLLFIFGSKIPWFGKLPGDILIHKKNVTFFFPITTSIIISLILTFIVYMLRK